MRRSGPQRPNAPYRDRSECAKETVCRHPGRRSIAMCMPTCPACRRCCRISTSNGATASSIAGSILWNRSTIRRMRRLRRVRIGAANPARPPVASIRCARRRSIAGISTSRSAIASTACNFCSARTWRRRSPRRSTTGLPRNGSIAILGCAPRSSCRCRTPITRSPKSNAARRTPASSRCWFSPWARRRSAGANTGRSSRPRSAMACRLVFTPGRASAIRSPRSAGRRGTPRIIARRRRAFRRRSRALSARVCSSNIPRSKWC